jgi:hypothetical protein
LTITQALSESRFHLLALLAEDQLLEPQQRDLLRLQHADHVEQGPQEPADLSLILLAQGVLLDFIDQSLDFGRIDLGISSSVSATRINLYSERHDYWSIFHHASLRIVTPHL